MGLARGDNHLALNMVTVNGSSCIARLRDLRNGCTQFSANRAVTDTRALDDNIADCSVAPEFI